MAKLISNQLLGYLDTLEQALHMPPEQSRAILDEVRADLSAHIQRHAESGCDEAESVELALEEMGPPDELARQMRAAVPPQSGPNMRLVRYVSLVLLGLIAGSICWYARAMSLGITFPRLLATFVIFTLILVLVWPGVIWRKNWMFSAIPTAIILLVGVLLMSAGQSQTTVVHADADVQSAAFSPDPRDRADLPLAIHVALGLFTLLTVYLLAMMQRRRQRLGAILAVLLVMAAIEVPFAVEEYRYTNDLDQLRITLQAYQDSHGKLPTRQEFKELQESKDFKYYLREGGNHYNLFWNRPLSPGCDLCYSSDGHRWWIND